MESTVSEQVSTEVADGFDGVEGGRSLVTSQVGFGALMVRLNKNFAEIPFVDVVAISCSIAFLSVFLNSFVVVFYRKAKTNDRPYILLLAALDTMSVIFTLLPHTCLALVRDSLAKYLLSTTRHFVGSAIFGLYLHPTFYLGLDRCVAVFFPHKFPVLAPKLRPFKVCLFVTQFLAVLLHSVGDAMNFGTGLALFTQAVG